MKIATGFYANMIMPIIGRTQMNSHQIIRSIHEFSYEEDEVHTCHFCGTYVNKEGYETSGEKERHWLSDCRPDLVEHEIGPICTWDFRRKPLTLSDGTVEDAFPEKYCCYGYNKDGKWTDEHKYFYPDGPC